MSRGELVRSSRTLSSELFGILLRGKLVVAPSLLQTRAGRGAHTHTELSA